MKKETAASRAAKGTGHPTTAATKGSTKANAKTCHIPDKAIEERERTTPPENRRSDWKDQSKIYSDQGFVTGPKSPSFIT